MFSISFTEAQNKPVEARSTAADSFYKFIKDIRSIGELEAQIKQKEQELDYLDELISIYDNLNCEEIAEHAAVKYNRLREEVLLLQLKKVDLEREVIIFELNSVRNA